MSVFSTELFALDPRSVQWRLHVYPQRRQRMGECVLYQVPGPHDGSAGPYLAQRIDRWAFDLLNPAMPLDLPAVVEEVAEGLMQRRIPGI